MLSFCLDQLSGIASGCGMSGSYNPLPFGIGIHFHLLLSENRSIKISFNTLIDSFIC